MRLTLRMLSMSATRGSAAAPFDLAGRKALVTGASGGLGRHFAEVLAASGASVALAARRVDSLAEAAGAITAAGGTAHAVPLDVSDAASVQAAVGIDQWSEARATRAPSPRRSHRLSSDSCEV